MFEGSVRATAARLRITAQLIDARTGFNLWGGGRYDRAFSDTLALQAEVSAKIVATLAETLTRLQREQEALAAGREPLDYVLAALEPVGRIAELATTLHGELLDWLGGGGEQ